MLTREEAEARFVEELGRTDRGIVALCRRHGLRGDDADDVASWIKVHLVDDDYAQLRKFRGDSSFSTFLTVVVARLFNDWRVQEWGRWRPSAEAQRRGALAMRLEQLVVRDGLGLAQAGEQLRTAGLTDLSDHALGAIVAALPAREPLRPHVVDGDAIDALPGASTADDRVLQEDAARNRATAVAALDGAIAQLPPEDRLLVRLRFWDGLTLADVARVLDVTQKPLYRRLEQALKSLRATLQAAGITAAQVHELLSEGDARDPEDADNAPTRPSKKVMAHPGARR